jgi:hypothetical protein
LEREIDQLVYALYGLTLEEIQIVAQRNEHHRADVHYANMRHKEDADGMSE